MKTIKVSAIAIFFLLSAACGSMPKTPELMIQNANNGKMYSDKEVFQVNRPFSQVATTFKQKAPECLNRTVTTTRWINGMIYRENRKFTSNVTVEKNRARLAVQSNGYYMLVADAHPVGKNTTRVESYVQWPTKSAYKAVKHWAMGTNMGCPDLTK